jgi:hypothetical protein
MGGSPGPGGPHCAGAHAYCPEAPTGSKSPQRHVHQPASGVMFKVQKQGD